MIRKQWSFLDRLQHKAIHAAYDLLLWLHDGLIEYACVRDLWRTPNKRVEAESEEPP